MNFVMVLREISEIVAKAVWTEFKVKTAPQISYAEPKFGDFATNISFELAKTLKQNPKQIAEGIASNIKHPQIEKASSVGGFVNIVVAESYWVDCLKKIKPGYGQSKPRKGQKVQVEFISANPTGPLTLGNARGGYLGDVLSRVLDHAGYKTTSEYYFNDAGTQISKLVESVKHQAGIIKASQVEYQGKYIEELASDLKNELKSRSDEDLAGILTKEVSRRYIKEAITRMGIEFDEWFNEKSLISSGELEKALELLRKKGLTYEKDGALWLKSTDYGDERDRVLQKSNGDVTYLGTDIAYHLNIFEHRRFDRAIKIWGADHAGQVPSLNLTMKRLIPDCRLDFVIVQWVRLVQGGKEVKMSKRAGSFVTVDELIDEIGSDVARFFFLMRSATSHMDFDLSLAKEQSQKNPLFYVMYSYVRAHSILAQAASKQLKPSNSLERLNTTESELVKYMTRLPDLISEIAESYEVHHLSFFATQLAKKFHDLYESERIIDLNQETAECKLYLIQQYITFMEILFNIIGVTPIKKMEPKV
ncbi:MAG TPA: arginine--tRNA ligase [Candidatus Dormibacteraeota bacterium]|nr:arginine--tRNA ligase [Candidatus Dormibacteraeota bacterium]